MQSPARDVEKGQHFPGTALTDLYMTEKDFRFRLEVDAGQEMRGWMLANQEGNTVSER